MAITFIASAVGWAAGSGSTLNTSTTLNIAAGDVLVAWGAAAGDVTLSIAEVSGAGNTLKRFQDYTNYSTIFGNAFVLEAAAASATATFRATFGASTTNRSITVLQFRPDANSIVHVHDGEQWGENTSTALLSGDISLIGSDVEVIGFAMSSAARTFSSLQINGATADGTVSNGSLVRAWYSHFTANDSVVNASGTLSSSADWYCDILAIRSVPQGGSYSSIRVEQNAWANDFPEILSSPTGGVLVCGWVKPDNPGGAYPRDHGNTNVLQLDGGAETGLIAVTCNGGVNSATSPAWRFNGNTMIGWNATAPLAGGDYTLLIEGGNTRFPVFERDFYGWNFYAVQYVLTGSSVTIRQWVKPGKGQGFAAWDSGGISKTGCRYMEEVYTFTELRALLVAAGHTQAYADAWSPTDISHIHLGVAGDGSTVHSMAQFRVYARSTAPTLAEIDAISVDPHPDTTAWADYKLDWNGGSPVLTDRSGNGRTLSLGSGGTLYQGDTFYTDTARPVSCVEAASATDTCAVFVANTPGVMTEAATATDTISMHLNAAASIVEAGNAQERSSTQVQLTEPALALDFNSAIANRPASCSETASATDTTDATGGTVPGNVPVSLDEPTTATETVTTLKSTTASVTETANATERTDDTFVRVCSEVAAATDTVTNTRRAAGSIVEAAAATDSVVALSNKYAEDVADYSSPIDVVSVHALYGVANTESASALESESSAALRARGLTEAGTALEDLTVIVRYNKAVSEPATGSDTTNGLVYAPRSLFEAGVAQAFATASGFFNVSIVETANARSSQDQGSFKSGEVVETSYALDNLSNIARFNAALTEVGLASDEPVSKKTTLSAVLEACSALATCTNVKVAFVSVQETAIARDRQSFGGPVDFDMFILVSGDWVRATIPMYLDIGGVWRVVTGLHLLVGGEWVSIY